MAQKATKNTSLKEKTKSIIGSAITRLKLVYHRITQFIKKYPLQSFYLALGLLLIILIAGRVLHKTPETITQQASTKEDTVLKLGKSPRAAFQAKIEKTGVVKIIAQAPAIVNSISVKPGDSIGEGQQILSLASNYQGGNAQSVQREIAQTQYQNTLDSFGLQTTILDKQRSIATASAENAQLTRDITQSTVNDTSNQINSLQSQLDQLNPVITQLQTQLSANPTDTTIQNQLAQSQQSAAQLQSSLYQLRASQRSAEYQAGDDKPPAQLANFQKDLTLSQLDVQQKSLEMGKEVSRLQSVLASIAESTMYPASPFSGIVERLNVHEGQIVNAGTELATITSNDVSTQAILLVPQGIAQQLITGEPSEIIIKNKTIKVTPTHVSTEATDGQLYAVYFEIPSEEEKNVSDGDYIDIAIPLGEVKPTSQDPLIPLDAIYVSQEKAQLLVIEKKKAVLKTVTLGKVYGNFVEVLTGVKPDDTIVMDRNVIAGDTVSINKTTIY